MLEVFTPPTFSCGYDIKNRFSPSLVFIVIYNQNTRKAIVQYSFLLTLSCFFHMNIFNNFLSTYFDHEFGQIDHCVSLLFLQFDIVKWWEATGTHPPTHPPTHFSAISMWILEGLNYSWAVWLAWWRGRGECYSISLPQQHTWFHLSFCLCSVSGLV